MAKVELQGIEVESKPTLELLGIEIEAKPGIELLGVAMEISSVPFALADYAVAPCPPGGVTTTTILRGATPPNWRDLLDEVLPEREEKKPPPAAPLLFSARGRARLLSMRASGSANVASGERRAKARIPLAAARAVASALLETSGCGRAAFASLTARSFARMAREAGRSDEQDRQDFEEMA